MERGSSSSRWSRGRLGDDGREAVRVDDRDWTWAIRNKRGMHSLLTYDSST